MNILQPWQLVLVCLAGWINRQQQDVIEYLQEENRVLRSKLKGKRIRFTDDERRRLAMKGKLLGRKVLGEVASIVTPDTILRLSLSRTQSGTVAAFRRSCSWGLPRMEDLLEPIHWTRVRRDSGIRIRARKHSPSGASANLRWTSLTPRGSTDDAGRRLAEWRQLDRGWAVRPRVSLASCDSTISESSIHGSMRSTIEGFVADVARSIQSHDLNTLAGSNRSGVPRTDSATASEAL